MEEQRGTSRYIIWWRAITTACAAIVFATAWFFIGALDAQAATLILVPTAGTFDVGDTFSGTVYVASADQAMNAASGTITFPPSTIEVTGIDKSGSIMNLWSQEPSYSNAVGTITFEGIVLNPGYTGTSGKVLTVNFRAKSAGSATASFSGGSVLANDGLGTNILTAFGSATYTIGSTEAAPVAQEEETSAAPATTGVPSAPVISSSTHPDPTMWYTGNNPTFSWSMPSGVDGANVLADHNATTDPGTTSDGQRSSWTYTGVDDGRWYFHVKLHNANGWGATSHFAFNIDSAAPDHFILTAQTPTDGAQVAFSFDAADELSGIDHYVVSINGGELISWTDDGSHVFTVSGLSAGTYTLAADAVDGAGNVTSAASVTFDVANAPETVVEETVTEPVAHWALPRIPIVLWVLLVIIVLALVLRSLRKSIRYKIRLVRKPRTREDRYARTERAFNRALRIMKKEVTHQLKKGNGEAARHQVSTDLSHMSSEIAREIEQLKHRL